MNFTRKTYYGMCIVSAALAIVQGVFSLFNSNALAIGSMSTIFYGLAMLLIAASTKNDKRLLTLCLVSALLLVVGLSPAFSVASFFVWPCFAIYSINHQTKHIQILSKLVITLGLAALILSFLSLPTLIVGVFYLAISCVQICFAYTLFKGEEI